MQLKMTLENQFQALLPPLLLHGLGIFIFFLFNYNDAMDIPIFFQLFGYGIIGFSFLCVFIVHLNYYLHERKRNYFFGDDYFEINFKNKAYRYSHQDISYVKIIEPGFEIFDYNRYEYMNHSFFFPSYSFAEIVLNNGNCIAISCFTHSNLEALLKRVLPGKNIVKDLKAIPTI